MKFIKGKIGHELAAGLATAFFIAPPLSQACETEPLLGSVCMTAASFCPRGYAEAAGQLMPITTNTALFSLLGTTYGGDGRSTFALPDLRGRSAIGQGAGPGLSSVVQGGKRGKESTTLTLASLPMHSHQAYAIDAEGTSMAADNAWPANPVVTIRGTSTPATAYAEDGSTATLNSKVIGETGDNQSFNNLPPQLGMRYCIAITGIFPSRN